MAKTEQPAMVGASAFQREEWGCRVSGWLQVNLAMNCRLTGRLERQALAAAIDDLVGRHEILRTTLEEGEDGKLWQRISELPPTTIAEHEIRFAHALDDERVRSFVGEWIDQPFDTGGAPLWRAGLFSCAGAEDDRLVVLAMNHVITDFETCELLRAEFLEALAARFEGREPDLGEPPAQFRDFAEWERTIDPTRHAAFWHSQMESAGCRLPLAHPDGAPSYLHWGMDSAIALEPAKVDGLLELTKTSRTTLAGVIGAAIAVGFSPWADGGIRLGLVFSGRVNRRFAGIAGPLVSILPVRIPVRDGLTFAEVLAEAREAWFGAQVKNIPIQVLFDLTGVETLSNLRLYDVQVNVVSERPRKARPLPVGSGAELSAAGYVESRLPSGRLAREAIDGVPLWVHAGLTVAGELEVMCCGDEASIPPQALRALTGHLCTVVEGLIAKPQADVASVLTLADRAWGAEGLVASP